MLPLGSRRAPAVDLATTVFSVLRMIGSYSLHSCYINKSMHHGRAQLRLRLRASAMVNPGVKSGKWLSQCHCDLWMAGT